MAGPGFKIADGYVDIHADLDRGELQRDVDVAVNSISRAARTVNLFVDLDRSDIIRKLDTTLKRIPRVARSIEIVADVDRTRITAAIESVIERIPRFARTIELLVDIDALDLARKIEEAIKLIPPPMRTITVNVDVDMGAALAQLTALRGLIGGGGVGGAASGGAFSGLSGSLAGLLPIVAGVTAAFVGLYAAIAVLPSLVGFTIAALGGLTTVAIGLTGVAGALVLGTRGIGDALKEVMENGNASAATLAKLTPAARSFVVALGPLVKMFGAWAKIAQEALFKNLGDMIGWVTRSLGVLAPFIEQVAAGLNKVAVGILVAVGNERHIEMIATIFTAMGRAIAVAANAIPLFINAFIRIGESAIPVVDRLAGFVHRLADSFQTWIADLDDSGQLDNIFVIAMREAKNLLDVLGGLIIVTGKFLGAVFFPGFEAGQASLKGVVIKLDEISAWLDNPTNVAGLRSWIDGFMNVGKTVLDVVGDIIGGFGRVAQFLADNRPALIGVMAVLAAGALAYAINMGIAAAATIAATWPILAIAAGITALVAALVAAYNNWDTFRDAVQGAIGWLQENGPKVFDAIRQRVEEFYNRALKPLVDYIVENREAFANLGKVLLVVGGIVVGTILVGVALLAAGLAGLVAGAATLVVGVVALVAVLYNFAQVLWDVFNNVRDFAGGVWEAIEDFAGRIPEFLGGVIEAVEGFFDRLWEWAQRVPEQIGGLIDPIEEKITGFLSAVIRWFTELPGRVGAAIAAAPGVIENVLRAGLEFVTGTVAYALGYALGTIVDFFLKLPGRIAEGAALLWETVTNVFTVVRNTMIERTVTAVAAVVGFFQALPGRVWGALVAIWDVLTNIFTTAWNIAVNLVTSAVDAVVGFFQALPGRAASVLSSLWGAISGAFTSARDQATATARSTVDSVTGWLASLPGRAASALSGFASSVANALRSAVGTATSIGRDIIQGLINGAQSMLGNLIGWARRAAGSFVQGFKDALRISSPSKVMAMEVGRYILPGIAEGLAIGAGDLDLAIGSATNRLVSGARSGVAPSATSIDRSSTAHYTFTGNIVLPSVRDPDDFLAQLPVAARQLSGAR